MKLFKKRDTSKTTPNPHDTLPADAILPSVTAAQYCYYHDDRLRKAYTELLVAIGFKPEHAQAMFEFDCAVIQKYDKSFLLTDGYIRLFSFPLDKPLFEGYPFQAEDLVKEHAVTISELCKLYDEAEWHCWNIYIPNITPDVSAEIMQWSSRGEGKQLVTDYLDMIHRETNIPITSLEKLVSYHNFLLKRYRWHYGKQ